MMFIAFTAVRGRKVREILSHYIDRVENSQISVSLSTEDGRQYFRKIIEEQGETFSDEEFDELVRSAQSNEYEINYDQTWHVQVMQRCSGIAVVTAVSDVGVHLVLCS